MKQKKNIKIITSEDLMKTEFYVKFKKELDNSHVFPENYMFKFIVSSDPRKIAKLKSVFDDRTVSFSTKESRGGRFTSVTVIIFAAGSDCIIEYYRKASAVEGIIML
jgi:putative lipoic acid-binding regulatory protein